MINQTLLPSFASIVCTAILFFIAGCHDSNPAVESLGTRLTGKHVIVYYKDPVNFDEAKRIQIAMEKYSESVDQSAIDGAAKGNVVSYQVLKNGSDYVIKYPTHKTASLDTNEFELVFAFNAQVLSEALGGSTVTYHLCDMALNTYRTVTYPKPK